MRAGAKSVLEGYLLIKISGNRVERFFHLCTNRNILLWNICPDENGVYHCFIRRTDFLTIRPICRKTKTKVRIIKRYGFPKYLQRYRQRFIFLIAFFGMIYGVYTGSTYVWNIEIVGNSYISDENVLRFLEENDIGLGTKLNSVDTDKLELAIREHYAQIIWSSAYMDGTSLVICVKEQIKNEKPSSYDSDTGVDLVASKNAKIASIITRKGTPCVVAGDEVAAGDILVSSKSDIYDDNGEVLCSLYQYADADVIGYVDYYYSKTIPIKSLLSVNTSDTKKVYFIRFFDHYFCFPNNKVPYEEYYFLEKCTQCKLSGNFYLPIYWGSTEYVKREPGYYILAEERAKQIAREDFNNFLKELEENGVSIIDKNVMIEEMGNCYEVSGHVYAKESITKECPVDIPPDLEEEE